MINLQNLMDEINSLNENVTLVAVSKNVSSTEVKALYAQGQRIAG